MGYINNILACILPEELSVNVYSDHTHTNIYIYFFIILLVFKHAPLHGVILHAVLALIYLFFILY